MFTLDEKMTFINIEQAYLRKLHDACSEVYYKEKNYELADFYGKLYYQAVDTLYEIIKDNEEALSYFYGEIN